MRSLSAAASAVVIAMALAVQGATLSERDGCTSSDAAAPICETSLGSPNMDDCAKAIKQLSGTCYQANGNRSLCTTLVTVGTCKIDACGGYHSQLYDGVICGGYLQTILNSCHSGGLVGGKLYPAECNVRYYAAPAQASISTTCSSRTAESVCRVSLMYPSPHVPHREIIHSHRRHHVPPYVPASRLRR
ncbi:hypothetical protein C8Q80DRAFT_1109823 [Daedaleopsis nitida]|nr:hypothetical protein C8Q80DRAFT_1109823 [Daedaleopsis nitida]